MKPICPKCGSEDIQLNSNDYVRCYAKGCIFAQPCGSLKDFAQFFSPASASGTQDELIAALRIQLQAAIDARNGAEWLAGNDRLHAKGLEKQLIEAQARVTELERNNVYLDRLQAEYSLRLKTIIGTDEIVANACEHAGEIGEHRAKVYKAAKVEEGWVSCDSNRYPIKCIHCFSKILSENEEELHGYGKCRRRNKEEDVTCEPEGWICCFDRLPAPQEVVIVKGGIAYMNSNEYWYTLTGEAWPGKRIEWNVTHWRPLPSPPKPKEGQP